MKASTFVARQLYMHPLEHVISYALLPPRGAVDRSVFILASIYFFCGYGEKIFLNTFFLLVLFALPTENVAWFITNSFLILQLSWKKNSEYWAQIFDAWELVLVGFSLLNSQHLLPQLPGASFIMEQLLPRYLFSFGRWLIESVQFGATLAPSWFSTHVSRLAGEG